jgi:hypothetical protein
MIKKVLAFVSLWDGYWSIPLAFLIFLLFEYLGRWFFGQGFGAYDPSTFQAAIMTSVVMIMFNTAVQYAIKFNFPTLWEIYHKNFLELSNQLTPWQNILLTVFIYCFFFVVHVVVFLKLI